MSVGAWLKLLLLSAIWGASFLFIRIGVTELGPAWLMFLRVTFAALFLLGGAFYLKRALIGSAPLQHFIILGGINTALPFLLYGYAATELAASLMSVLNATAPLWSTLLLAIWQRSMPKGAALGGLVTGFCGVVLLAGVESLSLSSQGIWALAAGLGAAICYAIASIYTKSANYGSAYSNAHGCMWAASAWLLPALLFTAPPAAMPSAGTLAAVVTLGVLCSGVAYLLYFRLIDEVGATSALTVTFLIPAFGILWGALFLGEHIGWHTVVGTAIILLGTSISTGSVPRLRRLAGER
ncbi:DMT family transporter [Shewanella sp.]|uniref:DMT family transporter n=1 Tax=Shewanella sp. TaxID=50422 RepID=UPI00356A6D6E